MSNTKLYLSAGTTFECYPLLKGVTAEPARGTITQSVPVTPAATAKGATSILVTAIGAGIIINVGDWLSFKDPTTGKEVLVNATAEATAGDTAITVAATPAAIAIGSTAKVPQIMANRTDIDLGFSANLASQTPLETNGWDNNIATNKSAPLSLPGGWSALDPVWFNMRDCFLSGRKIYGWIQANAPNSDYSKGQLIKGVFSIQDFPLAFPSTGFVQSDITLMLDGEPIFVDPIPTA